MPTCKNFMVLLFMDCEIIFLGSPVVKKRACKLLCSVMIHFDMVLQALLPTEQSNLHARFVTTGLPRKMISLSIKRSTMKFLHVGIVTIFHYIKVK